MNRKKRRPGRSNIFYKIKKSTSFNAPQRSPNQKERCSVCRSVSAFFDLSVILFSNVHVAESRITNRLFWVLATATHHQRHHSLFSEQ